MNDLDSTGNLYTDSGKQIPKLNLGDKSYIDKTIVIYGPSKTGKTVIVKNIMKLLKDYIDLVLIIAPSEPSNRSYEGYVNKLFIHYKLYKSDNHETKKENYKEKAFQFLESIWNRQEMMASIYTRTNRIEIIKSLFTYTSKHLQEEAIPFIEKLEQEKDKVLDRIKTKQSAEGVKEDVIKEAVSKFDELLLKLYKKYIYLDSDNIWKCDLSEDERYSLQYLLFNPRLLLIFDDCASQLKPFFTTEIFRKFFYQNRHSYITLIACFQDDTDLPTNLRKNVFINFFTEQVVCSSNFERSSNKYSKHTKERALEVIPHIFKGYRKLAYIREDESKQYFYHITFDYPGTFIFGSDAIYELCKVIQNEGTTMDTSNTYYEYFKL